MKQLIRNWAMLLFVLFVGGLNDHARAQFQSTNFVQSRNAGGTTPDRANTVVLDKTGFIYTAGQFTGTITLGGNTLTALGKEDIFVVKTYQNGVVVWAIQIQGTELDDVTGMAFDSNGDLYVTGYFASPSLETDQLVMVNSGAFGTTDAFLYKLDPSTGAVLWFQNAGGSANDASNDIYIDKFDQIYITGFFEDTADFGPLNTVNSLGGKDAFLARYDQLGNNIWVEQSGGNRTDYGSGVVTDSVGTVYMTGSFASDQFDCAFFSEPNREPNNTYDAFVVAYDSTRMPIWLFTGGGFDDDNATAIAIDSTTSELYITGAYTNLALFGNQSLVNEVVTGQSIYILKLDDAGNVMWATKGDGERAQALDIKLDANRDVYTTGSFSESLNFGCTGVTEWFENYGKVNTDIFITKHTADGLFTSVARAGAKSKADAGRALAYNHLRNEMILAGYFTDTLQLGSTQLISKGTQDAFWAYVSNTNNTCGVPTEKSKNFKKILPACEVSNDTIFSTGFTGKIIRWEVSTNNGSTFTAIDVQTPYLVIGTVPSNNAVYRAVVQSCDCNIINSDTVKTANVYAPTKGGNITGAKTLCYVSNAGTLTLSNHVGTILRWESSLDNFQSNITPIAVTIAQVNYSNITVATAYRAVLKNGLCNQVYSDTARMFVDSCSYCGHAMTIGGTTSLIAGNNPACITGGSNVSIGLVGNLGTVTRWELSYDNFATIEIYPGNTNVFPLSNVTRKTYIRAQVRNLTCFPEVSTATVIDVDSCEACGFAPSIAGTISLPADSVCSASNSGQIVLQNYFGQVLYWEYKTNLHGPYFRIRNQTDILSFNNLTQSRWYRVVVKSDFCRTDTTLTVFLKVAPCLTCPVPTKVFVTKVTDRTATINWKGNQRAMYYQVQYRPTSTNTWITVSNVMSPPLTITGLTANQDYQVRVRSVCSTNSVSEYALIVQFATSCSVPGSITADQTTVCKGNNVVVLRLNNPVGNVLRWEYSTNGFQKVSVLNRRTTTLVLNNIVSTTSYRAVVQNLTCIAVASDPVLVTVVDCNLNCAKPNTLIVSNIRPTTADLLWAIQPNVDAFEVSYRAPNDLEWTTISGMDDQTYTLRGLIPNTVYSVRLRNICSNGTLSDYSDVVKFKTPAANFLCVPPSVVTFTPRLTEADVNLAPVNGVVNYEITYRAINHPLQTTVTSPTETVTLRNLAPDMDYKVLVRTNCGNAFSRYTTEYTFRTLPVVCNAPANLRISDLTRTTAKVFWDITLQAPEYTVRYRPFGTSVWATQKVSTNTTNLAGLRGGITYEIQVQANCITQTNSAFSGSVIFTTPSTRESIADVNAQNELSLYPNPNKGQFYLLSTVSEATDIRFRLTDVTGKVITEQNHRLDIGVTELPVDVTGVSSGVYFLIWDDKTTGMQRTFKMVIE